MPDSASRTSSSLNGLMIAVTNFIALPCVILASGARLPVRLERAPDRDIAAGAPEVLGLEVGDRRGRIPEIRVIRPDVVRAHGPPVLPDITHTELPVPVARIGVAVVDTWRR